LENLSNDSGQEYFTEGMTDELISDLAQLGGMRVISRTSVMHYKGGTETVPQIGKELGVDGLVQGTMERVADRSTSIGGQPRHSLFPARGNRQASAGASPMTLG
jgi:TolB-like protein